MDRVCRVSVGSRKFGLLESWEELGEDRIVSV